MPTELEELVEFLHHGNTQIRQVAAENLVPYTKAEPALFKRNQLEPIKDLKLLVKDYDPIKQNALTMLINLSGDAEIREYLATDDAFLETLLLRITNPKERFGNELSMLLANLAKSDSLTQLCTRRRAVAPDLGGSAVAMDQLMDVFVRGPTGWNKTTAAPAPAPAPAPAATPPSSKDNDDDDDEGDSTPAATATAAVTYDYLAYVFADLAKHAAGAAYLSAAQAYDGVLPVQKLVPFTAPQMALPRRLGVASAIKNVALDQSKLPVLLAPELNLLTYLLLPLASGHDNYDEDEQERMLEDLQLLDESVRRDADPQVLKTHLETLLILGSSKDGRQALRDAGTYYVIRECHKAVEDEEVKEGCDRLVQVLQRGEPEDGEDSKGPGKVIGEIQDDSDDEKIVEVV